MKLKITKILEIKQPFQPQGKVYKIYQWVVKGSLDGVEKEYMLVKAFSQIPFGEGMEMDVDENNYNGDISYIVKKQTIGKKWGGYSKPFYNQKEYDALWAHAFNIVRPFVKKVPDMFNRLQVTSSMMATYIISATNAGVKIENNQNDKKNSSTEFLDQKNPNEDLSINWDEKDIENL